mgnify:CR=1 FL=1
MKMLEQALAGGRKVLDGETAFTLYDTFGFPIDLTELMARERGFAGSADHFRTHVARHRPKPPAEAYLRVRTLPGEQAQVDWGHFGHLQIGRARRRPLVVAVPTGTMAKSLAATLVLRTPTQPCEAPL